MNAVEMIDKLNTAVVWCDADFNVMDANPRCKQLFKELLNMENFVGRNMAECHKPETMAKLKNLFQEYKDRFSLHMLRCCRAGRRTAMR